MPTQHHNSYSKSGCHIVLHSSCFFVFAQKSHYNYKKSKRVTLQIRPVYSDAIIEQDDTVTAVKQCVAKAHGQLKKKKSNHTSQNKHGVQDDSSQYVTKTCRPIVHKKKYIDAHVSNTKSISECKSRIADTRNP